MSRPAGRGTIGDNGALSVRFSGGRRVRRACNTRPACSSKQGVVRFGLGPDKFSWAEIARDIRRLTDPAFPIACLVDVTNLQRPV